MEKKRSKGVTIFSVMAIILSLIHLLPLVLVFSLFDRVLCPTLAPQVPPSTHIVNIILGFGWLVAGIGCLRLKYYWGRMLMLFLAVFVLCKDMIFGIFTFKQSTGPIMSISPMISRQQVLTVGIISLLLEAIFFISLIVFFTRPKVKEQFK